MNIRICIQAFKSLDQVIKQMDLHATELHELSFVIERGLRAPLEGISEELLNFTPALNKMTIGQLALHCTGWAEYFLAEEKWEAVKWTCVEAEYPLQLQNVKVQIERGFNSIRTVLETTTDEELEITSDGKKGHGYIIYRLLIHAMVHANQMAYIRQIKEPDWGFGSHFGDMATAVIATKYSTSRDLSIPGF